MKKTWNQWTKIRSAMRDIWRYSPQHREAIKSVVHDNLFICPICKIEWPKELATVDHKPACGKLSSWDDLTPWTKTLFEGSTRIVCKPCHRKITAEQRRKK